MEIVVCIKQVPATNKVRVDEKTGVLMRSADGNKMNPYDLYALETALRLREEHGGRITAVTMGPPQAEAIVHEAYMMGVDEGYVFSDRRLGGADVLATSYALSQALRRVGDFDLILCGKQTTDGDTAQVGPAIAEHLGIPHAAWVSRIRCHDGGAEVEQQLADAVETVFMPFPCLVTVERDIYTPRLPSVKREREIGDKPVHILDLSSFFDQDPEHYGLSGSPTQVERTFAPENDVQRQVIRGGDSAEQLCAVLRKWKFIPQEGVQI